MVIELDKAILISLTVTLNPGRLTALVISTAVNYSSILAFSTVCATIVSVKISIHLPGRSAYTGNYSPLFSTPTEITYIVILEAIAPFKVRPDLGLINQRLVPVLGKFKFVYLRYIFPR